MLDETQSTTIGTTPEPVLQPAVEDSYRLHRRFDRMGRLIGDDSMKKLMNSHVMIIGLGGVGSWAAESLARSGVGKISLVDFDVICITNSNRQLHALAGGVGQKKTAVMAERLRKINPQAEIVEIPQFYNAKNSSKILAEHPDFVIDAIDNITAKCHLLHTCDAFAIPVVTSTGSAGRMDPTQIRVSDLNDTQKDPLARSVRQILRQQYGFPDQGSFGITAVFSTENVIEPEELTYDGGKGFKCVCFQTNDLHSCEDRNQILGSASFVTGAFGLTCASIVVKHLTQAAHLTKTQLTH